MKDTHQHLASIARTLRSAHPSYSPRLTLSDLIRFEEGVKTAAAIPCHEVAERLTTVARLCVRGLEQSREFILGHFPGEAGAERDLALFIQIGSHLDAVKANVVASLFLELAWANNRTDLLKLIDAGFDSNAAGTDGCALSRILVLSKKSQTSVAVNAINALFDVGARATEDMITEDLKPEVRALLEAAYLRQQTSVAATPGEQRSRIPRSRP